MPYALISVTDKTGIEKFAHLWDAGWTILSTGGTADYLMKKGVPVVELSKHTHFPEIMDGRVKTLVPQVHGGLLADRNKPDHVSAMETHAITPIDLLVVNLYDFAKNPGIENIDIGGPAMIRSAAKNYEHVTVVTSPVHYDWVITGILSNGTLSISQRRILARDAFVLTAHYDQMIAQWFMQT